MTHGLSGPDWALFKEPNKKKLVDCLTEKTIEGRCTRLTRYLNIAKDVLTTLEKADAHYSGPNPPTMKLASKEDVRVSIIAIIIQNEDLELSGILDDLDMAYAETPRMCERFARLVVGHEKDPDCTVILGELTKAGL